jgi:hypothetical protein
LGVWHFRRQGMRLERLLLSSTSLSRKRCLRNSPLTVGIRCRISRRNIASLFMRDSVISDLFSFTIYKGDLPLATGNILRVCVRYKVLRREYLDNNGEMNYKVTLAI